MKLANIYIIACVIAIPSLGMARDEPAPDMEMLEFLGGFETAGGKPIDPLRFADSNVKNPKKNQANDAKKVNKRNKKPEKQEQKERDDEK